MFQYEDQLSPYEDYHDQHKTAMRQSYLYHGDPYTGKTASLYWDSPLILYKAKTERM